MSSVSCIVAVLPSSVYLPLLLIPLFRVHIHAIFLCFAFVVSWVMQIAMQLLLHVQLPLQLGGLSGKGLCIYTEGDFPMSRLKQLEKAYQQRHPLLRERDFCSNIIISHVDSPAKLLKMTQYQLPVLVAQHEARKEPIKFIVIDSIGNIMRDYTPATEAVSSISSSSSLSSSIYSGVGVGGRDVGGSGYIKDGDKSWTAVAQVLMACSYL